MDGFTFSTAIAFLVYCFVSGITPGPANLLSLATAISKGKAVALRQWRGLFVGFAADAFVSALVIYYLGTGFSEYIIWFKWIGAAYIVWLAIHLLLEAKEEADTAADPHQTNNFWTGFLTQLTNVKVIIFCMTALSGYVLPYTKSLWVFLLVGAFLPFTGPACNLIWLYTGATMQQFFRNHRKAVNIVMAIALIGCAVSILK